MSCVVADAAWIRSLAWKSPQAARGSSPKRQKKKKKKKNSILRGILKRENSREKTLNYSTDMQKFLKDNFILETALKGLNSLPETQLDQTILLSFVLLYLRHG